ncbi:MAG: insulinase family protein [Fimbriimonadales bacterium]|nr:insulinase family protein [Fimbriimonadales bacterium]MDW8052605.1 pitrilysin family protein [Armatimonadota bacterium]
MNALATARIEYETYTLPNGLQVILSPYAVAPTVAVLVLYKVGSVNEPRGRTGFAHLFEHMMFQGSENVPREMHFKYVEANGGVLNGFTSQDLTVYFELLPASKLPLGLWLESDRMRALQVTQENLDNQRAVVKEERRLSIDNQPYARALERLREIAYDNFANQHSVIGSMEDLDNATLEDVQAFFRTYYAPNNAVLVIAGDYEADTARAWIERYFADIPPQPAPPTVDVSEPDREERREVFVDTLASVPALALAWKIPPRSTLENDALQIAGDVLVSGRASRLYQRLIKQEQVAVSVSGGAEARPAPSLFRLFVLHHPHVPPERVEAIIYEEIARLAEQGVSERELERVRAQILAQRWGDNLYYGMQSPLGRALGLAYFAAFEGDPEGVNRALERLLQITPANVQHAVQQYLNTTRNRTVMHIQAGASHQGGTPTNG